MADPAVLEALNDLNEHLTNHRKYMPRYDDVDVRQLIPQIIVVGDESSGKSSLLTALINCPLPVGTSTTTVCRIEVHMERSNDVSTGLYIVNDNGQRAPETGMIPLNEQSIGSAQKLIKDALGQSSNRTSFMREGMIHIKVTGPTCPNATYIDLPGLVQPTGLDKPIPQELVERYAALPNCLIVHVVSVANATVNVMISDPLLRKLRPETSQPRSVVTVITKADVLLREGHPTKEIIAMINGKDKDAIITCSRTSQETVSPEKEQEILASLASSFSIGRNNLQERLSQFTQTVLDRNKPELKRSLTAFKGALAKDLAEIGRESEPAGALFVRWTSKIKDVLLKIATCENQSGRHYRDRYVELTKGSFEIVFPRKFPETVMPSIEAISNEFAQLRGTNIPNSIGSLPLIKKYCQAACNSIENNVQLWMEKFEVLLDDIITFVLDQSPEPCSNAASKINVQVKSKMRTRLEFIKADTIKKLHSIYENPQLSDDTTLLHAIREVKLKPFMTLYTQLNIKNDIEGAKKTLFELTQRVPDAAIREQEAKEIWTTTTIYWHQVMASMQESSFSTFKLLFDDFVGDFSTDQSAPSHGNEILKAVEIDGSKMFHLIKENEDHERRRRACVLAEKKVIQALSTL